MTVQAPFFPHYGTALQLTATTASQNATIDSQFLNEQVAIENTGMGTVYVQTFALYDSPDVVASAIDFPLSPGDRAVISKSRQHDTIAYYSPTGSTLQVMAGDGWSAYTSSGTINGSSGTTADTVSTANSSTSALAGSGVFTGTTLDTLGYATISITVFSDVASATDGLSLQQSSNGTNWDITDVYTIPAATGKTYNINPSARYFRLTYTNGATPQTSFRLQVIPKVNPFTRGSVQRPQDARTNDNDYDESIVYPSLFNGTTWDRMRGDITNGLDVDVTRLPALVASSAVVGGTVDSPSSAAANALTPVTTSIAASSVVLKGTAGNLYNVDICTGGSAGYLMLFNAASAPADGVVTPVRVWVVAANASFGRSFSPPLRFGTGCTAVFSTTGPFTKTASATAFMSGECA